MLSMFINVILNHEEWVSILDSIKMDAYIQV